VAAYTQQGSEGQAFKSQLFCPFDPAPGLRKVYTENNSLDCALAVDRLSIERRFPDQPPMTRIGHVISRSSPPRKWVGIFALLAFFLQSLAVQTHIHQQLPLTVAKTASQGTSAPAPAKNQDPIDQCRLCQELAHAGHFITPAALAAVASPAFVAAIFAVLPAQADRSTRAFAWRSRAPPRH
jgi:hypothetical protein